MSTSEHRSRRTVAAFVAAALLIGGCRGSLPRAVSDAPVLQVATAFYPLAQVAALIGQEKVRVADVVPPGTDPLTYQLSGADRETVAAAGLAVEVDTGFQASFAAAAHRSRMVVQVGNGGSDQFVWLDPDAMKQAVGDLAQAMEGADPNAAALYRRNATSLQARISSLGIDYSSTLATCPGTTIVEPNHAFDDLAGSYGLKTVVIGPHPSADRAAAAVNALRTSTASAALSEPWVDDSGIRSVAAVARVAVRTVDNLAGPPPGGWPHGEDYFGLMEQNLGVLGQALGCGSQNQ